MVNRQNKFGNSTLVKIDKEVYEKAKKFISKNKLQYSSVKQLIDNAVIKFIEERKDD